MYQQLIKFAYKIRDKKLLALAAATREERNFSSLKERNCCNLSSELIDAHIGLYQGYVESLNTILEKLESSDKDSAGYAYGDFSELKRRLAAPYNGAILHELYFEHLGTEQASEPEGILLDLINKRWGSVEAYKEDVRLTGTATGNGWVVTVLDPVLRQMDNYMITEHHIGYPVGCKPIMVMDTWEHAFAVDYKTDREAYIEKFLDNLDFSLLESRI